MMGASMVLVGFLLPFVASRGAVASALQMAIDGATNLWLTPGAALAVLWISWSRRTSDRMRAARGAIFGLAVGGGFPLVYTARRIATMADLDSVDANWRVGLWIMVAGLSLAALCSRWFGAGRRRKAFTPRPGEWV